MTSPLPGQDPATPWPPPVPSGRGDVNGVPASIEPAQPAGPAAISTGSWGRPPAAAFVPSARAHQAAVQVGSALVLPPPAPPRPSAKRGPRRRKFGPAIGSWPRRTGLIEAGVAVAILVTVAIATSGPLGSHAVTTGWAQQGLPSLTALIDDATALQRSMPYPPARDIQALREDLAKADRLGPPPGPIPTRAWTVAGSQLHLALAGLAPGAKLADGKASALGALLMAAGEELQSVAVSLQAQ